MHHIEQAPTGKDEVRSSWDGYPSVTSSIAQDTDRESYIFRKFNKLTAREFPHVQSDLIHLEQQLEDLENEATARSNNAELELAIEGVAVLP